MAKKNNKFNRQNFMKMIGYTPDPKNENYAYYFPNIDDNKELFDNSDIASLAFTQSEYQCDTNKATKGISKRNINRYMLAKYVDYTMNEMASTNLIISRIATCIRDLNLDGSCPNETDLEHRIRSIVQDELNKR